MNTRRTTALSLLILAFAAMAWVFVQVIWIPLYRGHDDSAPSQRSDGPALQLEVERQDGGGTKSWSIADQQAIARLRAGLQSAEGAAQSPPPASEQKYRLRIRRPDSRVDEYDVILGPEGPAHDQVYVIRRNGGGGSVYGTAYNTPELRSALQQVLVPPTPK